MKNSAVANDSAASDCESELTSEPVAAHRVDTARTIVHQRYQAVARAHGNGLAVYVAKGGNGANSFAFAKPGVCAIS